MELEQPRLDSISWRYALYSFALLLSTYPALDTERLFSRAINPIFTE